MVGSLESFSRFTCRSDNEFCSSYLTALHQSGGFAPSSPVGSGRDAGTELLVQLSQSISFRASLPETTSSVEPGTTLETAYDIGPINTEPTIFADSVSSANPSDYFRFILDKTSNFNLALTGLSADADVKLLGSTGATLNISQQISSFDEAINQTLTAGTYYIQVYQFSNSTAYSLKLSATTASPTTSASNLLATEINLGKLDGISRTSNNSVGDVDTADVFRFNLAASGSLDLTLKNLSADADFRLIRDANGNGIVDAGEEIARSQLSGTADEAISLTSLAAGTYFVQVYQYAGNTGYRLRLSSTPTPIPDDASDTLAANESTVTAPLIDASDVADNTLQTARNIGLLSGTQTFNDFIGSSDTNDYYRFTLNLASGLSLSLTGLTADADVQLLSSTGELIARSINSGTSPESISSTLAAGTYYIRVLQYSGDTNYALALSATPASQMSNYSPYSGYGLVNASAAVAQAIGQSPFLDVSNLGGTGWGLDMINAPEVWARGYTGQGITVAVVDSGVDYTHPDLDNNIWVNPGEIAGNGIDDDGNGYVDDVRGWDFVDADNTPTDLDGHGTHLAGTIAAENNGVGVTGVAYNARIMPVRVLDATGFGTYSTIAAGIRYAADNGARVINLSLGGSGSSDAVTTAIQYATQRGAVVVISAGNESQPQPNFPANLTNQWGVSVGSVDINSKMSDFSNYAGSSVLNYVVAPGSSIYSTTPNNTYQYYSGTSMAAPYVSGVAALILSAANLPPAQVVSLITGTANSGVVKV